MIYQGVAAYRRIHQLVDWQVVSVSIKVKSPEHPDGEMLRGMQIQAVQVHEEGIFLEVSTIHREDGKRITLAWYADESVPRWSWLPEILEINGPNT